MSNEPAPRPNTRSQSHQLDPEAELVLEDSDDEPFEYESDIGSAELTHDQEEEEEDQLDEDNDSDVIMEERNEETEVLVLSSDAEEEGTPEAPPDEAPRPAPKGKMTARKQFAADCSLLSERFGASSTLNVQSESVVYCIQIVSKLTKRRIGRLQTRRGRGHCSLLTQTSNLPTQAITHVP